MGAPAHNGSTPREPAPTAFVLKYVLWLDATQQQPLGQPACAKLPPNILRALSAPLRHAAALVIFT